jgi:hypothetical protein
MMISSQRNTYGVLMARGRLPVPHLFRQVNPDLLFSNIEINIARISRKRQAVSRISQLQQDLSYKLALSGTY